LSIITYFLGVGRLVRRGCDVASAEGGISVAFAQAGAKEVVGIEGRELYVSRAKFVTEALRVIGVQYELGDVRQISRERHGEFDFTINSGILHHLGQDDFYPFLDAMAQVTRDTMFLYTHVSTPDAVAKFRLRGPVMAAGKFEGFLLQEHAENASREEREEQVKGLVRQHLFLLGHRGSAPRSAEECRFRNGCPDPRTARFWIVP
jgi:2-polyprenyl-3-methyl-5-hydroxy-6-metoxy-1,4-benzoquinol methylase